MEGPPQRSSSSQWSLDHRIIRLPDPPRSHHSLPYSLASASGPSMATAHRDLWPVCPLQRFHPIVGKKASGPSVPCRVPRDPSSPAASLPTTDSLVNYLYPLHKCSTPRSRQTSLFCWQPQDMWRRAGDRANVQVYELDRYGVEAQFLFLLCDLGPVT